MRRRTGWAQLTPDQPGVDVLWQGGLPCRVAIDEALCSLEETQPGICETIEAATGRWVELGTWCPSSEQPGRQEQTARLLDMRAQPTHQLTCALGEDEEPEHTLVCLVEDPDDPSAPQPAYRLAEWLTGEPPDWERAQGRWLFRGMPPTGLFIVEALPPPLARSPRDL